MTLDQKETFWGWVLAVGVVLFVAGLFGVCWYASKSIDTQHAALQAWRAEHCRLTRVDVISTGGVFGGTRRMWCYACDDGASRCY